MGFLVRPDGVPGGVAPLAHYTAWLAKQWEKEDTSMAGALLDLGLAPAPPVRMDPPDT